MHYKHQQQKGENLKYEKLHKNIINKGQKRRLRVGP